MQRRSFLASIVAAGVTPAAIGSGVLMPIKRVVVPAFEDQPHLTFSEDGLNYGIDLASAPDQAVSALIRFDRRSGFEIFEISIVDARGWAPDDPCRFNSSR